MLLCEKNGRWPLLLLWLLLLLLQELVQDVAEGGVAEAGGHEVGNAEGGGKVHFERRADLKVAYSSLARAGEVRVEDLDELCEHHVLDEAALEAAVAIAIAVIVTVNGLLLLLLLLLRGMLRRLLLELGARVTVTAVVGGPRSLPLLLLLNVEREEVLLAVGAVEGDLADELAVLEVQVDVAVDSGYVDVAVEAEVAPRIALLVEHVLSGDLNFAEILFHA